MHICMGQAELPSCFCHKGWGMATRHLQKACSIGLEVKLVIVGVRIVARKVHQPSVEACSTLSHVGQAPYPQQVLTCLASRQVSPSCSDVTANMTSAAEASSMGASLIRTG